MVQMKASARIPSRTESQEVGTTRRQALAMLGASTAVLVFPSSGHASNYSEQLPQSTATYSPQLRWDYFEKNRHSKISFVGPYTEVSAPMSEAIRALSQAQIKIYELLGGNKAAPIELTVNPERLAQIDAILRKVWTNITLVPEFQLEGKEYSAQAFDQFIVVQLPRVLAKHGIFSLPYIVNAATEKTDLLGFNQIFSQLYKINHYCPVGISNRFNWLLLFGLGICSACCEKACKMGIFSAELMLNTCSIASSECSMLSFFLAMAKRI